MSKETGGSGREGKNLGGRPTKLNAATQGAIVAALESGSYREVAARAAGVGVSTLRHWMEIGEADMEHDRDTIHSQLRQAVLTAEAKAEADAVAEIRKVGLSGTWTALAWLLERKYPARWGRKYQIESESTVTAEVEVTHSKVVEVVPDDEVRAEVARILGVSLGVGEG